MTKNCIYKSNPMYQSSCMHSLKYPIINKRILTILIVISTSNISSAFNLDVQHPIVFEDPSDEPEKGSYFGYSVLLYAEQGRNKSWIQIGAPRAMSTLPRHKDIVEPGSVYRCSLFPIGTCNPLLLDDTGNDDQIIDGNTRYRDRKDGAWIGASMDAQHGPGGRVVVCGPRWINHLDEYYQLGVCYWSPAEDDTNDGVTHSFEKLIPLIDKDRHGFVQRNIAVYDFGMGEAGMSVHLPLKKTIEEKSELLIGAPGMLNWRGGSVLYEDGGYFHGGGYNKRSISIDGFSILYTPERELSHKFKDFDYLGYQVSSGYFFDKNQLLYAASAPRATNIRGKVLIYSLVKKKNRNKKATSRVRIHGEVQGIQCGEYFGASMTVGDLNNDELDDLLVGAPMFTKNRITELGYDDGRVAVFLGSNTKLMKYNQQIIGKEAGGRFGSAVSFLGDLDFDGFPEVGVGAPYEDNGRGVVYIYTSNRNGFLSDEAVQRLTARRTHDFLRGFGSSITNHPVDIDRNGCPDVAVGAYASGHAVIYRGRPVVRWRVSPLRPRHKYIARNATDFTFEPACVTYLGINAPGNLAVWRTVEMDTTYLRCHVANDTTFKKLIHLKRGEGFCDDLKIYLKPNIKNFLTPIEVHVSYQLSEEKDFEDMHRDKERPEFKTHPIVVKSNGIEGNDNFCQDCPISQGPARSEVKIPFEIDCGGDDICSADLSIIGKLPQLTKSSRTATPSFVSGSSETLKFKVLVSNSESAEKAYLTLVYIELGPPALISRIPPECYEISRLPFLDNPTEYRDKSDAYSSNSTEPSMAPVYDSTDKIPELYFSRNISSIYLRCDLDVLLPASMREVLVELDMTNINGFDVMQLNAWATTVSNETNPSDNWWSISVPLQNEADIAMAGRAVKELYTYFKESKNESESSINFLHVYEVQKFGYSPLEKVSIELQVPMYIENIGAKKPLQFLSIKGYQGYQGGQPLSCTIEDEFDSDEGIATDSNPAHSIKKRFSNQGIPDYVNLTSTEVPSNRTLFINCSSPARTETQLIKCISVNCAAGPLLNSLTVAKVLLSMVLHTKHIKSMMGPRDIILLETYGFVRVIEPRDLKQPEKKNRPDHAGPYTLFIGDIPKKKVESWVLAVAIGAGIMIVLFLAMALAKAGFFERKKKKELKDLKRQTLAEVGDDAFNPDEQEIEN